VSVIPGVVVDEGSTICHPGDLISVIPPIISIHEIVDIDHDMTRASSGVFIRNQ